LRVSLLAQSGHSILSPFYVALGGKADMPVCIAHVCLTHCHTLVRRIAAPQNDPQPHSADHKSLL
jgi:hypothetical protein